MSVPLKQTSTTLVCMAERHSGNVAKSFCNMLNLEFKQVEWTWAAGFKWSAEKSLVTVSLSHTGLTNRTADPEYVHSTASSFTQTAVLTAVQHLAVYLLNCTITSLSSFLLSSWTPLALWIQAEIHVVRAKYREDYIILKLKLRSRKFSHMVSLYC